MRVGGRLGQAEQAQLVDDQGGELLAGHEQPHAGHRPQPREQQDAGGDVEGAAQAAG
jgi:hypothetical protein